MPYANIGCRRYAVIYKWFLLSVHTVDRHLWANISVKIGRQCKRSLNSIEYEHFWFHFLKCSKICACNSRFMCLWKFKILSTDTWVNFIITKRLYSQSRPCTHCIPQALDCFTHLICTYSMFINLSPPDLNRKIETSWSYVQTTFANLNQFVPVETLKVICKHTNG